MEKRMNEVAEIEWQTPEGDDNSKQMQKVKELEKEFLLCDKQISESVAKDNLTVQQIRELVTRILWINRESKTRDDETDEEVQTGCEIIVQKQALSIIQDIQRETSATLEKLLSKLNFNEVADDLVALLESHLLEMDEKKQFLNIATVNQLISQQKLHKFDNYTKTNQELAIEVANELMATISIRIMFPILKSLFMSRGLHLDYLDYFSEILEKFDLQIFDKFKQKQTSLWNNLSNLLQSIETSLNDTIKSSVDQEEAKEHTDLNTLVQIQSQLKKKVENNFYDLVREIIGEKSLFWPLYQQNIANLNTLVSKLFHSFTLKKWISLDFKQRLQFSLILRRITPQITQKQFQFLSDAQITDLIYFLICFAPAKDVQDKQLLFKPLSFLHSLLSQPDEQTLQLISSLNILDIPLYDILKTHEDQDLLYLVLTEIYLIISNVQVCANEKRVLIGPYYGYLMELRYALLRVLNVPLKGVQCVSYWNHLDMYFEDKMIYVLSRYSDFVNIFKKADYSIEVQKNQQDYSLLNIMRREIDLQDKDYNQMLQNEFARSVRHLKEYVKISEPKLFFLQKVSVNVMRSRNVVIAVSGFTSQNEDKNIKWLELASMYPQSEIFALQFESKTVDDIFSFIQNTLASVFIMPGGMLLKFSQFLTQSVSNNPFKEAEKQANLSGIYLAHLLASGALFPNCSISLVGFSMGTQVISTFLKEYSSLLIKQNSPSVVNSVVFMGGSADVSLFRNPTILNAVKNQLHNCYSHNDQVLKYILRLTNIRASPVGLMPILKLQPQYQAKIINHDFSSQIKGHKGYMKQYTSILSQIDFKNDFIHQN